MKRCQPRPAKLISANFRFRGVPARAIKANEITPSEGKRPTSRAKSAPNMTSPECTHPNKAFGPETGRSYCGSCGLYLPGEPVPVGQRLIPVQEYLRRLEKRYRELDFEILRREQQKHQLMTINSEIRDVRCAWSGCESPPMSMTKGNPSEPEYGTLSLRQ